MKVDEMIQDSPMSLGQIKNQLVPFSPYQININHSQHSNQTEILGG